ncbi:secretion system protein E [bacterium]|nr:secretion system protein E [bacterium]
MNDDDESEEIEYVLFQGATNGIEANLEENKKLVAAGLTAAKELVSEALEEKSEMLKLQIDGKRAMASFFVDGMKRPGPKYPGPQANAVIQMLKLLAGLDITVRDKPQRGGISAKYRDLPFELMVKTQPGQGAEQLTVTMRNLKTKRVTPEDIGIPEVIKAKIRDTAASHRGVILIAGPPESGVTTTALCALRCVDSYLYQCFILGNLYGREVLNVPVFKPEPGHTLEMTIDRIKRNEGDVIFFDEFIDPEVVKTAMMAASDICIMSEMYARDAADAIAKYVGLVGDPITAAENLACVVSHKLIRKLCTRCREAFRPSPKLLAQVGLNEDTKTLYRKCPPPEPDPKTGEEPEPCRACGGLGFRGRVAVFEMIEPTEAVKEAIVAGADPAAIRAAARKDKQITFQKDALRLVEDGTTGLEELKRVFAPPAGKKKAVRRRPPQ